MFDVFWLIPVQTCSTGQRIMPYHAARYIQCGRSQLVKCDAADVGTLAAAHAPTVALMAPYS